MYLIFITVSEIKIYYSVKSGIHFYVSSVIRIGDKFRIKRENSTWCECEANRTERRGEGGCNSSDESARQKNAQRFTPYTDTAILLFLKPVSTYIK